MVCVCVYMQKMELHHSRNKKNKKKLVEGKVFVDTVGIESADFGSRVRRISELSRCRKIKGRIPLILRSKWKFTAFPKI